MMTNTCLGSQLPEFVLEWEMFQTKRAEKSKTNVTFNTIVPKLMPIMRLVWKYGTARQATDGNLIQRMRSARWITKATDRHSECITLIAFPRQQWLCKRATILCYTRPLPVLFIVKPGDKVDSWPAFLNRRAAAPYRALASIIPGREKFCWNW